MRETLYHIKNVKKFIIIFLPLLICYELSSQVKILKPTLSDTVFINQTNRIEWSGNGANPVQLEYSSDYGQSWNLITDKAYGISYDWIPPFRESARVRIRAISKGIIKPYILWDIQNAHSNEVNTALISDDGNYILSAGKDRKVKIWDIISRKQIDSLVLSSYPTLWNTCFYNGIDSILIAAGSKVILWDRINKKSDEISGFEFNNGVRTVAAFRELGVYAAGDLTGSNKVIRINDASVVYTFNNRDVNETYSIAFSENGSRLINTSYSGFVYIHDWQKKLLLYELSGHGTAQGEKTVWSGKITPDNSKAITCGVDKTVRFWDLNSGSETSKFETHSSHVRSVAASNNGLLALSGSLDSILRQYEVEFEKELDVAVSHGGAVLTCNYSETADSLVSGGRDNSVKLWKNFEYYYSVDSVQTNLKYKILAYIPDLKGIVGQRIDVPIILDNASIIPEIQGREVMVDIRSGMPKYLLHSLNPIAGGKSYTRHDTVRVITPNSIKNHDTVLVIESLILLGDKNYEDIKLINFEILGDSVVVVEKKDGSITIIEYCSGSTNRRLEMPETGLAITSSPQPAKEMISIDFHTIEDGIHKLQIFDSKGNMVNELMNHKLNHGWYNFKFLCSDLPSGSYLIRLNTPNDVITANVLILH